VPTRAAATRTGGQQSEHLPSRGAERPVGSSQLAQNVVAGIFPRLDVFGICLMLVNPFVKQTTLRFREGKVCGFLGDDASWKG